MNCPICGSPGLRMPNHPEVELHRCAKCSHAFSRADSIAQPERYGSSYYEVDHKRWFEHPNLALFARVASFIPLGASVLDVGCGRGDFLRFARNSRPDLRLAGIDIAKNDESSDGVRFLQGDIFQMDADEHFDAIVSLAVIEHVADVTAFVRKLRELMKPRAIAAVMTLNDSSLLYGLARAGRRACRSLLIASTRNTICIISLRGLCGPCSGSKGFPSALNSATTSRSRLWTSRSRVRRQEQFCASACGSSGPLGGRRTAAIFKR